MPKSQALRAVRKKRQLMEQMIVSKADNISENGAETESRAKNAYRKPIGLKMLRYQGRTRLSELLSSRAATPVLFRNPISM